MNFRFFYLFFLSIFLTSVGFAQNPQDYIGRWILIIDNDARQRVLEIRKTEIVGDALVKFDAVYGYSDGPLAKVESGFSLKDGRIAGMKIKTPANSAIDLSLFDGDIFYGIFSSKENLVKNAFLIKESEVSIGKTLPKEFWPVFGKSLSGTPKQCLPFLGVFLGQWEMVGTTWLWVTDVDVNCIATFAYTDSPIPPTVFKKGEIKDEVLFVPIKGGVVMFSADVGKLKGHFSGGGFGADAVFLKVNHSDGSLEREFAIQRLNEHYQKPSNDVPESCAGFFGVWDGGWQIGNYQNLTINVTSVEKDCTIRFTYGNSPKSRYIHTSKVSGERFSFLCNSSTAGTCSLERKGDVLIGSYTNPSGGTNFGQFKRR